VLFVCLAALEDTDAALANQSNNQSNNQSLSQAHFRRGQALFFLDRFVDAKSAYQSAHDLGHQIRKCDAEIKRMKPVNQPTTQPTTQSTTPAQAAAQSTTQSAVPLSTKVKDQWFQNKTHVTITLFARDLPKDQIKVTLNESSGIDLSAHLVCKDGSVYDKSWKLFAPVDKNITLDVTAYRVEIILTKIEAADWLGLEEAEKQKHADVIARENVIRDGTTPHYPTSSKKKVEWTEVEQSAKKLEEEEKPTGDAALQKLFQTIYKDSDEDTRRAMIKSFQTSGGTVLSTNWKEVAKTDYTKDRKAPDGQEFVDPK
jgi:hypothetical protein